MGKQQAISTSTGKQQAFLIRLRLLILLLLVLILIGISEQLAANRRPTAKQRESFIRLRALLGTSESGTSTTSLNFGISSEFSSFVGSEVERCLPDGMGRGE